MKTSEYRNIYEVESSHWWYVALHDLVIACLPDGTGLRILDAGCGTGGLLKRMDRYGNAVGCDASSHALDYCSQRGVRAFKSDLNAGISGMADFDVITLIDVIYHRNVEDDSAVLKKIYSVLRPGGRLILQVPAYAWLRSSHDEVVHTARRYTREEVCGMLNSCGFRLEKATYRVSLLLIPVVITRLIRKITRCSKVGPGPASDVKRHSAIINNLLYAVMKVENTLLKYVSLPFGTSVFAVARKPDVRSMPGGKE